MRPSVRVRRLMTGSIATLALIVAGCGGDPSVEPTPTATITATVTETETESPTPTVTPTTTETPTESPDPSDGLSEEELPGEAYDGPPVQGLPATLAVVGVGADDVLNVRVGPWTDYDVIARLTSLEDDVRATGRARLMPSSIWIEVEVDGVIGWSSSRYLAFLGQTDDVTSQIVADHGSLPTAETLVELANIVAELRASVDPASRIVISDGPDVGDLGEVTVDVVGLGDDAQFGERLVIFATPDESGEGFTVKSVEGTSMCGRGPDSGGGCP